VGRGAVILLSLAAAAAALALPPRLSAEEQAAVQAAIDRANAAELPGELLADKVKEGLAKGVPGPRIVGVVGAMARSLDEARAILAPHTKSKAAPLYRAVLGARSAGVPADALTRLGRALGDRPAALTAAVEGTTDLVQRGYPQEGAVRAVLAVGQREAQSLGRLVGELESLRARYGASRTEALDAVERSASGLSHAGELLHPRAGGLGNEEASPNRDEAGDRGPGNGARRGKTH
jgi:hypothetical protein